MRERSALSVCQGMEVYGVLAMLVKERRVMSMLREKLSGRSRVWNAAHVGKGGGLCGMFEVYFVKGWISSS